MLYLLSELSGSFGPLRLFSYVTFRAAGAWLCSLLLVLLLGSFTARKLRALNVRAAERLEGLVPPEFIDRRKSDTPCMGGLLLIGAVAVSTLLWAAPGAISGVLVGATLLLALTGFADDFIKVTRQDRGGLPGKWKLAAQFAVAAGALWIWSRSPQLNVILRELYVPFAKEPVLESWWCFPFAALVIVGASNAVNLTDGKDGLASGCTIFCALTYAVFTYMMGHRIFAGYLNIPHIPGVGEAVVFAAALCGACIGFLWHNCHPAAMFMGDTGSLPLGGAVLYGLTDAPSVWSDSDVNALVRGGVTAVENAAGIVSVVRGVTSRTTTGGADDVTWRELTTILVVDDVIPAVRDALRSRFARSKNTAQTRGAIRTQVIIELENKLAREIIDSYGEVTAVASAEDPTVCVVSFAFTVAHGLNQVHLTASITV